MKDAMNQAMNHAIGHSSVFRTLWSVLLLGTLGLGSAGAAIPQAEPASPAAAFMAQSGLKTPREGAAEQVGRLSAGPQVRAGMDAAPEPAKAVVADARVPAWETRYGTAAGLSFTPPLAPPPGLSPLGPEVELGAWRSYPYGGSNSIVGVAGGVYNGGTLYAGVLNLGVLALTPLPSGGYSQTLIQASPGGLASNNVTSIASSGEKLWVGTSNAGISELNLVSGTWSYYSTGNSGLPSNAILHIDGFSGGGGYYEFMVGTAGGAWWYYEDPFGAGTSVYFAGQAVNEMNYQVVNGLRYTWFALDGELWLDNLSPQMTRFSRPPGCALDGASSIAFDGQGGVWVGAQTVGPASPEKAPPNGEAPSAVFPIGACRYYNGSWTQYNSAVPGLPSDKVTDLESDNAGRVWMAFRSYSNLWGGVAVYDQGTWLIFQKFQGDPLPIDEVISISIFGEAVWFGYWGYYGLDQYSPNWRRYNFSAGDKPSVVFLDPNVAYVGSGTRLTQITTSSAGPLDLPGNVSTITSMARQGSQLWVGTAGSGVYRVEDFQITRQTAADGLASDDVRALTVDSQNRLWVATSQGLSLRGNGYWLNFTSANSGLGSDSLTALAADNDGRLYLGTAGDGIYTLAPDVEGGQPWSHLTTADGLAGNDITGLAAEPGGAIWAISSTGQARRDPATGAWTATGSENSTAVTSDPAGRVWLGTTGGLWELTGGRWVQFLPANSLLDAGTVASVAADNRRSWIVQNGGLWVHGEVTGPIGFIPPTVQNFNPAQAGAGTPVTLNGAGYVPYLPARNIVSFGNLNDPYTYGDVVSAYESQLVAKVPILARSGKIWVRANRLNGASIMDFTVLPAIRGVSPTCAALGGELRIEGSGFNSGQALYVQIGNGPWRLADAYDPISIRQRIRPGDTDGPVSVRIGQSGVVVTSSQAITIDSPKLDKVGIQQAIEGLPLVWPKRTLILLTMRNQRGLCGVRVDGGQLEFLLKDGSTRLDWKSFQPTPAGLSIGASAPAMGVNTAISFVMWSNALSWPDFSLADFNGVRLHLFNGPVELMTFDIPASSFNFTDLGNRRKFMNTYVYDTADTGAKAWEDFYANANKGLDQVARVYPQSDLEPYYGKNLWLYWGFRTIGRTDKIDLSSSDVFHELQGQVEDLRTSANDSNSHFDQATGVIAASLKTGNVTGKAVYDCSNPFGDCDIHSTVAFNMPDDLAHTWLQEATHTLNWVSSSSPNHDASNKTHSKYNNLDAGGNCQANITFRQALIDQLGFAARTVRLEADKKPYEFQFADCSSAQMPASVMSYASSEDDNVFYEPLDYLAVFNLLKYSILGPQGAGPTPAALGAGGLDSRFGWSGWGGGQTAPTASQELRLSGEIGKTPDHPVSIHLSYLDSPGGDLTQPSPKGLFTLVFRAASGTSLYNFPFDVGATHTHGAPEDVYSFSLRTPFPDGTASVAITHDGQELWSARVSANAPSVSLSSPVQGMTYHAADPMPVAWTASDPDGDPLAFILEYSPDDGATWQTIATGLSGTAYDWTPGFVPVGISRLRLTATDGFNTAQSVSEAFYIQPTNPIAIILTPQNGGTVLEGGQLSLAGDSIASASDTPPSYDWSIDGQYFASGQSISTTLDQAGQHTISLQVIANGLGSQVASASIEVIPDYDHDGLSNAFEQAYGVNPLDRSDSAADPDSDGLQTLEEQQAGTSPVLADGDGDGVSDGSELAQGSNPSDANSQPPAAATLHVGAESLGFVYRLGDATPAPKTIWIVNTGPGTFNWSAQSSAAWLSVSPAAGAAGAELTLTADPSGLAPGIYTASVQVTASGAAGSPHLTSVWIKVYAPDGTLPLRLFLPFLKR